jgi:porphobilinogen deaminase
MSPSQHQHPVVVATRGSALALAQAHQVVALCQKAFPKACFSIHIIKTTGDKLQTAAWAQPVEGLPKGLFTKELEAALLCDEADLAVHSLKDLPTDLPAGLILGAVCRRTDVRDVLIYRDARWVNEIEARANAGPTDWSPGAVRLRGFKPGLTVKDLPEGATIATSSTRRQAQLKTLRPDLRSTPIRGNVGTRLQKLKARAEWDATILAAAGLARLQVKILPDGRLLAAPSPHPDVKPPAQSILAGLLASPLEPEEMLPCVGQAAIGIEIREKDERLNEICRALNHANTWQCVAAERAFLHAMGGGCQSPVAAYARVIGHQLCLKAVSYRTESARGVELCGPAKDAVALGETAARQLLAEER